MSADYYRSKEKEIRDLDLHVHPDEENKFITIDGKIRLLINFKFAFDRQNQKISGFEVTQVWNTEGIE
jgi:hypothetical protein